MKVCPECKKEYNDEYKYCPKCGKPYDNGMKKIKTPENVKGDLVSVLKLIWNIVLYIIGIFFVLIFLIVITEMPVASIFGILFGLSFFQIFYQLIENKTNLDKKFLIAARIVIPIILFFVTIMAVPNKKTETTDINAVSCLYKNNISIIK